jgi:hypothetical protein
MTLSEATALLDARLRRYRGSTYEQLIPLLNHPAYAEGISPSGAAFRTEVSVFWEKYPFGNLRVFGIIDGFFDSDTPAPVTQSFIVAPED